MLTFYEKLHLTGGCVRDRPDWTYSISVERLIFNEFDPAHFALHCT
jgi:hypothetical protein